MTRKYGPWRGILIASAIFGIVHGIPQQALNAFFVGAMIGFIYYKTQSLIPCILIHALNNAVSYFVWMLSGEKIVFTKEMFGSERSAPCAGRRGLRRPAAGPSPASYARSGGIATRRFRRRKRPKTESFREK